MQAVARDDGEAAASGVERCRRPPGLPVMGKSDQNGDPTETAVLGPNRDPTRRLELPTGPVLLSRSACPWTRRFLSLVWTPGLGL